MIEGIEFDIPNIIGYRISGHITTADIKPWAELLDATIKEQGKLRLYVEYDGIEGLTWNAVKEDLKFDINHLSDFEKAAVVTDKTWVNLPALAANILPNLEVKTFTFAERPQAIQWIKS
ncbi:hypothetical protein GCM10023187_12870 [Nibrella viscosa]|uniref:SpoIIAA-like n=1 Tax=Nibrella viscosa TaxID=1084524 RepID=A0ABP8K3U0_9BACT